MDEKLHLTCFDLTLVFCVRLVHKGDITILIAFFLPLLSASISHYFRKK